MTVDSEFAFKAIRGDGALETGSVMAPSREAAAAMVGARGVFPYEVAPRATHQPRGARPSLEDLAAGLRALSTLLSSGLPVTRALSLMSDLAPKSWVLATSDVLRTVQQGEGLGEALRGSSLGLAPHVVGMITAGEAGGGLAPAVARAAQLLDDQARIRSQLHNALAYPAILAVTGSASIALLVGVVLPRFADLMLDAGQALPLTTLAVLTAGKLVKFGLIPAMVLGMFALMVWRRWTGTPAGRERWDRLLNNLPVLGSVRRSSASANACAALAALLDAGVPLAAAMGQAAPACGNRDIESRLRAARQRIALGASPSAALKAEVAVTLTVSNMVRLGEETGRLAEMVAQAGAIESVRALREVQQAIRVIEPAMILGFGTVVLVVAAALLQAMYGLRVG